MKTFTGGYHRSPRYYADLVRFHRRGTKTFARETFDLFRDTQALGGSRLLEIGCGGRAGATLLHHTCGARITGIDFDIVGFGFRTRFAELRENGVERAAKTLLRQFAFDRAYYDELANLLGRPLRFDADLRRMDARKLALPDDEFDLVYSNWVFEHIDGIDEAAREIARVLKPSGKAWLDIHLFPCLSGGHVLSWREPSHPPRTPPPWDHLRARTQPADTYLNELSASDYLEVFRRYFTVESLQYLTQGEDLATEEIVKETGYSREDLTRYRLLLLLTPLEVGESARTDLRAQAPLASLSGDS